MRIACLMPTYGRRRELLENSIACFVAQDYADKLLLIYDDLGALWDARCDVPGVVILSNRHRRSSVGAKYNEGADYLSKTGRWFDAIAVWDDDDIYLPNYLSGHVEAFGKDPYAMWSKPPQIISAYHQPPQTEDAAGRFHGSIVVHRAAWKHLPWIDTTRATFDQEYIAALVGKFGPPAKPPTSYVYRWQTSGAGHCSGLMGREDWYEAYKPDSREPIKDLTAKFDDDTRAVYARFGCSV